jgi:sigma-B regulation protein RsbU (phosphoserine phosphatase)
VRILIVDDDEAIRFLLAAQLRSLGHEIDVAANGSEAWTRLNQRQADLLVCDWNMPVMNGLELCRKIRESDWPSYIYIVLCTAMNQKADFLMGMETGADDFVLKPVDFSNLRVKVRAAERILNLQRELTEQNNNLKELYRKLRLAYDTIETDLMAAAALQMELLPKKMPPTQDVRLDWLFIPSLFLAGDMLNYFFIDKRLLVFYHLDVAGHGIPAAMLSVMLNYTLSPVAGSPIAGMEQDGKLGSLLAPAEVVSELNRRFQSSNDSYFTMIYGVFDTTSRILTFCQAGHPGPLVLSADGNLTKLGSGGFPVGLMPEMEYEQQTLKLNQGDKLVLYSDGIPECLNQAGQRYTEEQFFDVLKNSAQGSLEELISSVRKDISRWRIDAELSDDVSLLVMESLAGA